MATKKKGSNTHLEEYTNKHMRHDLQLIAQSIADNNRAVNILVDSNKTIEERLVEVESIIGGEDDFSAKDRKKALSVLADQTINPDEKMLPQMTETPDRMILPMAIKHAQNEFLKILTQDPDSKVLFSDLLMKWIDIKMRSRHRALIGEALGFSQIETEKQIEEADSLVSRPEG